MRPLSKPDCPVVILGAGPAGLTAAYEKDSTVGGISRTTSCLGLEYFCFEGDGLWNTADADLAARNIVSEMRGIGPRYDLWKVNAGKSITQAPRPRARTISAAWSRDEGII